MRRLWLARHAEATIDESGLTAAGRRQAELLGQRLINAGLTRISHSPLARAVETAEIVAAALPGVPVEVAAELDDSEPSEDPAAAEAMVARFANPAADELCITHNFQIGWFLRAALQSPPERWLGLNSCNTGVTVLQWRPGRPGATPLVFNDVSHLPPELRWTGFPPELSVP
ncbi:phosphoglycerate mutase family protein [Paractinoplanes lichenicola]|uniref:Histidine phosphatase family protein n=1 Tax=Paractinoplanes lichenicola TaxID=2802976 RepID=A0ABS1VPJ8_9ACTN|nr:phosphoglycerate mutase family protein [Actinoplanes lichenicola]MBL7256155.1 histidine phosphatase family protein [Actinoplanes lichenicola]